MAATRPATILQDGRAKAYRPLAAADRRRALAAGLAAYERGDFFEAHELLEPAWMGASDPAERSLHQGLIKLAAAFVHAVRGNPLGVEKNLRGARLRLAEAGRTGPARSAATPGARGGRGLPGDLDLDDLVAAIDDRLARLARLAGRTDLTDLDPPTLRRTAR